MQRVLDMVARKAGPAAVVNKLSRALASAMAEAAFKHLCINLDGAGMQRSILFEKLRSRY